jgi:hypothetical protein
MNNINPVAHVDALLNDYYLSQAGIDSPML